ncbi:MAG TPA: hypothetical protein VFE47_11555 [Tepidisphaeraceae bacterium]|jgi:hypothetical protein|nr:hypothetical protein [Tepidisphaeraceae bacterium]
MIETIGEELLARDGDGKLRVRIATVFPAGEAIVTLPGIHATQRIAYVDRLNDQRVKWGLEPLNEETQEDLWCTAVDLIVDDDAILIRPDPSQMDLAFAADELLQQLYSKKQIKFLYVLNPQVRQAIKQRGECWRINPLPRSPAEMSRMISASRIGIGGREIYYYNAVTGTRLLTCGEFCALGKMDDAELRNHLIEIRDYCVQTNRMRNPEIGFFMADAPAILSTLAAQDFAAMDGAKLRSVYDTLCHLFRTSVRTEFQTDDVEDPHWRSAMYAALIGQSEKSISEEVLLGLSAEFFMQVEWVPGGRLEDGELILDPVFEEEDIETCCVLGRSVCDMRARSLIFNFIREYGDLEHVNLGRVAPSLSHRHAYEGHRGVYLAEIQKRGASTPMLRIIRMQKRGVWELLDQGCDLLDAITESEEYTEQILDRRLACRQLGMNLPPHVTTRKLCERYTGTNAAYQGRSVWSTYFERDYIHGLATDKVPAGRFADDAFALAFARVLGRSAAPNLIVGRCDKAGQVIFDSGDELLIDGPGGLPVDIVVTDHTGTFMDYRRPLADLAAAYAQSTTRRSAHLSDDRAFGEVFLQAFAERFMQLQQDYQKRKRAFRTLFTHQNRGEASRFMEGWECTLDRLAAADCGELVERIRGGLG